MRSISYQLVIAAVGLLMSFPLAAQGELVVDQPVDGAGLDVMVGPQMIPAHPSPGFTLTDLFVAVDFQALVAAPITSIDITGEFKTAWTPSCNSLPVGMSFSIFSNIPAQQNPQGFAKPGRLLWSQNRRGPFDYGWGASAADFYNPQTNTVLDIGDSHVGWVGWAGMYASPADAFYPTLGETYWLVAHPDWDFTGEGIMDVGDIGVLSANSSYDSPYDPSYGWRSSTLSLGSSAVWSPGAFDYQLPATPSDNQAWQKLVYPAGHPLAGQGMDLAFQMWCPHDGDINDDGWVDVGDLGILGVNYGQSGRNWATGDLTGDGVVDVGDLGILGDNYGWDAAVGQVPEPATLSLLALGLLGLRRR